MENICSNGEHLLFLELQQSTNCSEWTTLSQRMGTGSWTGTIPTITALSSGRIRWNFNDAVPSLAPKYFLWVIARELP